MLRSSEAANVPRWRSQDGFYEIWFLVVFEPDAERAYWFRYTTYAPAAGRADQRCAMLWAAAFDARCREAPAVAAKAVFPIDAYAADHERFSVRIGRGELGHGFARGEVDAGGHRIEWDLRFDPAPAEVLRMPRLAHALPLPVESAHANSGVRFDGSVVVDGQLRAFAGAPGTQTHIWGSRRVAELRWLYAPRFAEDPDASLEAIRVRALREGAMGIGTPALTSVALSTSAGSSDSMGLADALTNRLTEPAVGCLHLVAGSPTRAVTARAFCEPRTLVGYVYRDPAGWEVYVAQSDVASCVVETFERRHPFAPWRPSRRLTCRHCCAVEFHQPRPIAGVRYIPWTAES